MTDHNKSQGIDSDLLSGGQDYFGDDTATTAYNRVWFNILRTHRKLLPEIGASLRESGIKDPIWYEIFLEIERGGATGRLASEIQDALNIPQYAMSRHVTRMLQADFVRREFIADGRRKQVLHLTEKSKGLSDKIWPQYMAEIQAVVSEKLTTEEGYVLTRLLIKLQQ